MATQKKPASSRRPAAATAKPEPVEQATAPVARDSRTELSLSTLKPAHKRRARKRIGRGMGSGKGRFSGRGVKGQKSRAGSHRMRPGFEGGQMPLYMRLPKQRGSTSKDAMPIGPHRTQTVAINVGDLDRRFEPGDEVTPETLLEKRLLRNLRLDVKILGNGELTKKLAVTAHLFSATAREKIEQAGGTATALREPKLRKRRRRSRSVAPEEEAPAAVEEPVEAESGHEAEPPPEGEDGAES